MSEGKKASSFVAAFLSIIIAGALTVGALFLLLFTVCIPMGPPLALAGHAIPWLVIYGALLALVALWGAYRTQERSFRWGLLLFVVVLTVIGLWQVLR